MSGNRDKEAVVTGSCACGEVQWRASTKPEDGGTVYCYCNTCGKIGGCGYLAFVHFKKDNIEYGSSTKLVTFEKTSQAKREHCSQCGSCISMRYGESVIAMVGGSIDEGQKHVQPPSVCIFTEEKPPWVMLPDGVPAFAAFGQGWGSAPGGDSLQHPT